MHSSCADVPSTGSLDLEKEDILKEVENLKPHLDPLRILLYGPVGTGKSSFVNSVQRVLLGRNAVTALESSAVSATSASYTLTIKTHKMQKRSGGCHPFVFCDTMGLEAGNAGIQAKDIIKVLKGHILDDYKFNPMSPITSEDSKYKQSPDTCDKIHCVVCIISADSISRMHPSVIEKIRTVQKKASELNIVHIIVLTKVDEACKMVNKDLRKLYHSRKISEKVEQSSHTLGISLNNIYPVKNYHSEITEDTSVDVIILMALRDIINFANDYAMKTYKMKKREGGRHPFAFRDIMGLESDDGGIQAKDIIKVLKGHILDDYKFNPSEPITAGNPKYKQCPDPRDKVHCLVSIVPADAEMDPSVINKMKTVRKKASELQIPQVIVLTKVDKACEIVNKDLRKLYCSRKIREK
ncbi:hypothetical protein NFI96_018705, partial [Prochilodus magdalenae]